MHADDCGRSGHPDGRPQAAGGTEHGLLPVFFFPGDARRRADRPGLGGPGGSGRWGIGSKRRRAVRGSGARRRACRCKSEHHGSSRRRLDHTGSRRAHVDGRGAARIRLRQIRAVTGAGLLRSERYMLLLLVPRIGYRLANQIAVQRFEQLRARLHAAVTATGPLDADQSALVGLVHAGGIAHFAYPGQTGAPARARIAELARLAGLVADAKQPPAAPYPGPDPSQLFPSVPGSAEHHHHSPAPHPGHQPRRTQSRPQSRPPCTPRSAPRSRQPSIRPHTITLPDRQTALRRIITSRRNAPCSRPPAQA